MQASTGVRPRAWITVVAINDSWTQVCLSGVSAQIYLWLTEEKSAFQPRVTLKSPTDTDTDCII